MSAEKIDSKEHDSNMSIEEYIQQLRLKKATLTQTHTPAQAHELAIKSMELYERSLKVKEDEQKLADREFFKHRIYNIIIITLLFVAKMIFGTAIGIFKLSDSVLISISTTSMVAVFAFFHYVLSYLYGPAPFINFFRKKEE